MKHTQNVSCWPFGIFWVICSCVLIFRLGYDIKTWHFGSTIVVRSSTPSQYDYLLHFPRGYHDFGKRPLLVFLHGAGEVGKDVSVLKELDVFHYAQKANFFQENASRPMGDEPLEGEAYCSPRLLGFPFIVVSPVTPTHGWKPKQVIRFLDDFLNENRFRYRIDTSRIYLTGLSMGGFGTFDVACEYPNRFAAIAPLAGGGDPEKAKCLLTIPTWAFHDKNDKVVAYECTSKMIDAMKALGDQDVRLSTLHDIGHNIAPQVYADPELYRWLLKHKKIPHKSSCP